LAFFSHNTPPDARRKNSFVLLFSPSALIQGPFGTLILQNFGIPPGHLSTDPSAYTALLSQLLAPPPLDWENVLPAGQPTFRFSWYFFPSCPVDAIVVCWILIDRIRLAQWEFSFRCDLSLYRGALFAPRDSQKRPYFL